MEHINFEAELSSAHTEVSAEQLADWIRQSRLNDGVVPSRHLYEGDLMRRLCLLAGLGDEYAAASGSEQREVASAAARKLGVTI